MPYTNCRLSQDIKVDVGAMVGEVVVAGSQSFAVQPHIHSVFIKSHTTLLSTYCGMPDDYSAAPVFSEAGKRAAVDEHAIAVVQSVCRVDVNAAVVLAHSEVLATLQVQHPVPAYHLRTVHSHHALARQCVVLELHLVHGVTDTMTATYCRTCNDNTIRVDMPMCNNKNATVLFKSHLTIKSNTCIKQNSNIYSLKL